MANIGKNLRAKIKERGKTQSWLSQKTGIGLFYINRLCNDKIKDPRLSTCLKIADALGCWIEDIWRKE